MRREGGGGHTFSVVMPDSIRDPVTLNPSRLTPHPSRLTGVSPLTPHLNPPYSALIPCALMIFAHFPTSSLFSLANCSGVLPTGIEPDAAMRATVSGD